MARSRGTGLKWHPEGLAAALQRRLAPTGVSVRIRRRRPRGRIVGGWGCRQTPPVRLSMLLTIKELAVQLRIKPSTLYAWASQSKIPCVRIHGLIRFHPEEIERWMSGFAKIRPSLPDYTKRGRDIDEIIAAAKRAIYNPRHGETGPALSPRKGE
jgi:excisionase family DNA binding protein